MHEYVVFVSKSKNGIDNGMIQYCAHTESRLDRDLSGAVIDEDNVYYEYTFYVVTIQE